MKTWHDAPAQDRHSQAHQHGFNQVDRDIARRGCLRQEEHPQRHALHRPYTQQAVGNLREDAGAVAGLVVGRGAAMREPRDGGEGHREEVVAAAAVGARHEADAAGVAFAPGIEQTKSPLGCGSGLVGVWSFVHAIAPRRSLERVCR